MPESKSGALDHLGDTPKKHGCGRRSRTSDLWGMNPTRYQLCHPAISSERPVWAFHDKCNLLCLGTPCIKKFI